MTSLTGFQAINREAQEGSPYRNVLLSTVGTVFLGTPFQGSDVAGLAGWQVAISGIMGEQTSNELIRDLDKNHDLLHRRIQKFTEIANADSVRLPMACFFETKPTEMLRRLLPRSLATQMSTSMTFKMV